MRPALLLALAALACAPRAPERAPTPAVRPAARPAAAPTRGASTLETMLAEDMAAEQAIPWTAARRLVWSDFKGPPPKGGNEGARTGYGLYYAWSCRGATFQFRVTAAMHPQRSWVKPMVVSDERENPRVLRHEQTHFDVTEVFARRMRAHFDALAGGCAKSDAEVKAMAKRFVDEERDMQHRYDRETNHGLNVDQQRAWNTDVAGMLAASRRYTQ